MTLKELFPKINDLKAEVDSLRPMTSEQEGRWLQKVRLDWNFHSSKIEGRFIEKI